MTHRIVHWEVMGPDGDKLSRFYADLFGWRPEAYPGFDNYHGVTAEEAGVGGAVGQGNEQMPAYLTFYVEVERIDDHLAKVAAAGGQTVVPRTVIPGMVAFAMFSDPAGNTMGLVESEPPPAEE